MPERSIFQEPVTQAVAPLPKKGTNKKFIVRVDPVKYFYAANAGSKNEL